MSRIARFELPPGTPIAGKYLVEAQLGRGWEGEVYRVRERRTGILRAVKVFFPQRNPRNTTLRRYAKKLQKLRRCELVTQYHSTETILFRDQEVDCLVSELVEGQVLEDYIHTLPNDRMHGFEALHFTYALARGLEEIHLAREYHGDLHDRNVFIQREGIFFRLKVFDFFDRGKVTREHMQDDIIDAVRMLYDAVGGPSLYKLQPKLVQDICCGLRNDIVRRRYPTASHLRRALETYSWS